MRGLLPQPRRDRQAPERESNPHPPSPMPDCNSRLHAWYAPYTKGATDYPDQPRRRVRSGFSPGRGPPQQAVVPTCRKASPGIAPTRSAPPRLASPRKSRPLHRPRWCSGAEAPMHRTHPCAGNGRGPSTTSGRLVLHCVPVVGTLPSPVSGVNATLPKSLAVAFGPGDKWRNPCVKRWLPSPGGGSQPPPAFSFSRR